MATAHLDANPPYVVVTPGDTLSAIARDYKSTTGGKTYRQIAKLSNNNIKNPDLIYVGQTIYLAETGSGGGGTSEKDTADPYKPKITGFGPMASEPGTLLAVWECNLDHVESYKVMWTYYTADKVWFEGSNSEIKVDKDAPNLAKHSTYTIPANATQVKFKVKPISEKKKENDKETTYWDGKWSDEQTYKDGPPLGAPGQPKIEVKDYQLTASLEGVDIDDATGIIFEVVQDNKSTPYATSKEMKIETGYVSYTCKIEPGHEYKVHCKAYDNKTKESSEWSGYSSSYRTIPAPSSGITVIKANSETSIYLEWGAATAAKTYELEYSTEKDNFDMNSETTKVPVDTGNAFWEVTGLESGTEYFFRVRAKNDEGDSAWSDIKSVVIGTIPSAPTTWSSTTTAVTGEAVNLYWVHNSKDSSSETYAYIELYISYPGIDTPVKEFHEIQKSTAEDEKDKTGCYELKTDTFVEGVQIEWQVRTKGIVNKYGDFSAPRKIDVYAKPTLDLKLTDKAAVEIETVTSLPLYIQGIPGPDTQTPIGYHLTVKSNEAYETVDNMGNPKYVNVGDAVYSKYFDTTYGLTVELSAEHLSLENNISYTATCVVSMNSGLTAEDSLSFNVSWADVDYAPNAEISIDEETLTATLRPYCYRARLIKYIVNRDGDSYVRTTETTDTVFDPDDPSEILRNTFTTTGEKVYFGYGVDIREENDNPVYYCTVEERTPVTDVLMSVYRREYDGSFTEIAVDLDSAKTTAVTDPHPALDYARYRIVAKSKKTSAVSYNDLPGHPIGNAGVVIQWDEAWTSFEVSSEDALAQPSWTGSMLKLPYNIDVTNDVAPEVSMVNYIGRSHPVSYYGTQLGETASWSVEIDKADKETIYALRRLAKWIGDVYVREPSGTGYWANIKVSFSLNHCENVVPVSFSITRVEGGM